MTVSIYVPDMPEFMPLIAAARQVESCRIGAPCAGYWRIEAEGEIRFERRALGLGPALWNSALAGGFKGRILEYDRDVLRITDGAA